LADPQPNYNSYTTDTRGFHQAWVAEGKPKLYAELNEKTNSFSVTYTDKDHNFHKLGVPALEESVPSAAFNASTIKPGDYRFGGGAHYKDGGTQLDTIDKDGKWADEDIQYKYGRASTPIRNKDGSDGIPAVDKHTGGTHYGEGVEIHAGGSALHTAKDPQAAYAAHQPLVPTMGCVRVANEDAYSLGKMVQESGGSIPMRVTASEHSLLMSKTEPNGHRSDWRPMPLGQDSPGSLEVKGDVVVQTRPRAVCEFPLSQLKAIGFDPENAQGNMHIGLSKTGEPYVLDDSHYKDMQRTQQPVQGVGR